MAELHASACPLDCPDACSLRVEVEDGRVVSIEGDERNPLTQGFACGKVRGFARHMYGAERLRTPLVRVGDKGAGEFRVASWDEALDLVAARLAEARRDHGGESILPICYGGSNGALSQDGVDARLFRRLGATRLAKTVCAAPSGRAAEGLYGRMTGVALPDYVHARLVVLWGCNPHASGIHLVPILKEARARGAKIVVVDPRRTSMAKQADLHLPVRPGTDLPLALAIHRWLFDGGRADLEFLARHATGVDELRRRAEPWTLAAAAEECGVTEADIEALARLWADSSPAVVRCGWGPERNRNGGSATAAILALPAVAGKLGVRGGGFTMSNSRAMKLDAGPIAAEPEPPTRIVNMNRLGRALTELTGPPVKVLFSYNCNPLATMPNQALVRRGLAREDLFCVVFEQVMTDTARWADVILPATTFLEHDELALGYGAIAMNRIRPAAAPVGEARPNHEVFAALLSRLGLSRAGDPDTPDAMVAAALAATPRGEEIARALEQRGVAFPASGPAPIPMVDELPRTADGKIHLVPPELDAEAEGGLYVYRPDPGTRAHPLALISPASAKTVSSTFGQLDRRPAALGMHPRDAEARGIADGDTVRVWSELGEVRCRARIDPDVRAGVTVLHKGLWSHHTLDGNTANAVAPDTLADLGGGATFNDARVQVERIASP
jgi:anaerobic selenocysteine-containing dehydrogenase